MSANIWITAAAGVIMATGLAGVAIPVIPGLIIIWLTALVYGFAVGGYGALGILVMILISVLLVISLVSGVVIPKRSASEAGASTLSQVGGLLGAVTGFFAIPVIGVFVGALLGVLVVEYSNKQDWAEAWVATKGLAKGFGISTLIDFVIGVFMIFLWLTWALATI